MNYQKNEFKEGDVVTLLSNQIPMVVYYYDPSNGLTKCVWMNINNEIQRDTFPKFVIDFYKPNEWKQVK